MTYSTHTPLAVGRFRRIATGALAAVALSACAAQGKDEAASDANSREYPTPPEFIACKDVPAALAQADAIVRKLGLYSTTREGAYWAKRQERLVARSYQCKGR